MSVPCSVNSLLLSYVSLCCIIWSRLFVFFFFSSRRRHTRLVSDWSSDVCSSDLNSVQTGTYGGSPHVNVRCVNSGVRSEEHTSELQSLTNLVCRLLLEKKKKNKKKI